MATSLKSIPCQHCGAPIAIRAQGISITFACASCGSVFDATQDGFKVLTRATQQQSLLENLPIALGSRGVLFDIEWEVIGYVRRQDVKWGFYWDEYLLFNPYQGFRFLIHSDQHFSVAELLTKRPVEYANGQNVTLDGQSFALFHKGVSRVNAVAGEFYWRVRLGDECEFADFISPPKGISKEIALKSHDVEKSFSLSRYVPIDDVERAFRLSNLTRPWKSSPIQPNPLTVIRGALWRTAFVSCLGLILAQLYFTSSSESEEVFRTSRFFAPSEAGIEQLIGEVEIDGYGKNVRIESHSPVNNSWVEVTYELESEDGTESGWASQAIEYYHGNSSGEYWSEGSTHAASVIAPVGANRYKVFATVYAATFTANMNTSVSTRIIRNVPIWSNFVVALFAILAFPILCLFFERIFERGRWEESDYSPFNTE
jgi:hypothetical protein